MRGTTEYAEYVTEVREEVCSHCTQRHGDGAVLVGVCHDCGVERSLPWIVESIHDAEDALDEADPAPDPYLVCAQCGCLGSSDCPCAARTLVTRLVRAIRSVDERHAQWDIVHRRIAGPAKGKHVSASALIEAYETATNTVVGCD